MTSPSHPIAAAPARRLLRRFGRAQSGATMVEFGMVSTPFILLLAAIFEMALMFWTSQILEEATTQASRAILTGQASTTYAASPGSSSGDKFRTAICERTTTFINCGDITVDVRSYTNFAGAATGTAGASAVQGGALNTSGFGYTQATAGQIVVVRAVLKYKLFFTPWAQPLANIGNGERALVASTTFRTEPAGS